MPFGVVPELKVGLACEIQSVTISSIKHSARQHTFLLEALLVFLAVAAYTLIDVRDSQAQESVRIQKQGAPTIRKFNLGPEINSGFSELSPIISPDGQYLFFTMGIGNPENMGAEHLQDCYVSHRNPNGSWSAPINLGAPINSTGNDAISGVSPDGSVLFIKNFGYNKTSGLCFAKRTKTGWKIDSITIDDYRNLNTLASQCISTDRKYIIFSAERPDGYGGLDLYVTRLIDAATNHYGVPENLGPVLNTAKDDFAPFLAADGQSLYFSSKGHGGYGDADVFVAKRLDESWVNWTAPKNLGPELNTAGMDAYYSIPASGDVAYYSSANGANHLDLYMVTLSEEFRPKPVILVTGKVVNHNKSPLEAGVSCTIVGNDTATASTITNILNGHFAVVLPSGQNYSLHAESQGYLPYSDNLDLTNAALYQEVSMTITLDSLAAGSSYILRNIFFDFDRAELRSESKNELNQLSALLKHNQTLTARIEGYTDSVGTTEHNIQLSKARAESVLQYLVSSGIEPERLTSEGFGATGYVATNRTEEGRQFNRRVVFRVLSTK